jgi:hypothetical protein
LVLHVSQPQAHTNRVVMVWGIVAWNGLVT